LGWANPEITRFSSVGAAVVVTQAENSPTDRIRINRSKIFLSIGGILLEER
jgi:hypothetical protein